MSALFRALSKDTRLGPRLRRMVKLMATLVVLAFCLWISRDHLEGLEPATLRKAISDLTPLQWLGALGATTIAFLCVAGQERAITLHLGYRLDPTHARGAAMAAAAVSQTLGFGPLVGAIVRRRLLPDLTGTQSFAISAAITLFFFTGLGLLFLGLVAIHPIHPFRQEARWLLAGAILTGIVVSLLPWKQFLGFAKPSVFTVLRLVFWVALDVLSLGLAFWVLLPSEATAPFLTMMPVFVMALGVGVASGSPAGTGPFEATVLAYLPEVDQHGLVAGILAFRFVAYALPALLGALWALVGRRILPPARQAPFHLAETDADHLARLPRAEVQLIRQGELDLLATRCGHFWLSGTLPATRVFIGDPMDASAALPRPAALLRLAQDRCRTEKRRPLFYKIGPASAAVLRRQGMTVLPVGREAVLDPQRFTTQGSARSGLRRKLRHAEQSGVTIDQPGRLPMGDMDRIAAIWSRRHGGQERGYSMGRYTRAYVAGQRVFTARDASGRLIAFVSFHASDHEWVLDLIRSDDHLPDGTLYALVVAAIDAAKLAGVSRFSLAAVPDTHFGLPPRLAAFVKRPFGGADGLYQFKQAFAPKWEPRYIAAKGWFALGFGGFVLARAIHAAPDPRESTPEDLRPALQEI